MDGILDTNILIDILRRHPPAVTWMNQQSTLRLGVPSIVRMELIYGSQNKIEQARSVGLTNIFEIVYPNEPDAHWAMLEFERFHLSHKIEIIDCFVAAMGVRLGVPVFTRNRKDFMLFSSVQVHAPY